MSSSGIFQIDMPSSFAPPVYLPPSQPVSPLRTQAHHQTYTPTFRVPYRGAPKFPSNPSPPSPNPHAPARLPVSDARTRRWVTAHAVGSPAPVPPTYSYSVEEQKSVFSDDSDSESVLSYTHGDEDEIESTSDSSSDSDDDDESAIFMTRNHSHLRLRSTNPSTTSLARPPSSLPRGRPAARRVARGLRPITPPSAAPVILDHSRARGLWSSAASKHAPQHQQQHPRSCPSLSSFVAPSLTTDDSDESTTPSVSESIPIPSALSRGRCRPSRIPPTDDDSEDERWWMPSPPDAARKERERATGCGAFWDGWMKTGNYA